MRNLADYTEQEVIEHIASGLARPDMLTKWRIMQGKREGLRVIDISCDNNVSMRTVIRCVKKHS